MIGLAFLRNVPVAVPEICCSLSLRQISTAATPFCSLNPPQAAVANVPTAVTTCHRHVVKSRLKVNCPEGAREGGLDHSSPLWLERLSLVFTACVIVDCST